jgi:hypothetical protein
MIGIRVLNAGAGNGVWLGSAQCRDLGGKADVCELILREIGTLFGGMDYAGAAQRIRRVENGGVNQRRLR